MKMPRFTLHYSGNEELLKLKKPPLFTAVKSIQLQFTNIINGQLNNEKRATV
jgi:hypothetical protein